MFTKYTHNVLHNAMNGVGVGVGDDDAIGWPTQSILHDAMIAGFLTRHN